MLVNGTSIDFFVSPRDLRQRSPLIFVFMMEALSLMLLRAEEGSFL